MLIPFRQLFPLRLDVSEVKTFDIEPLLPLGPIISPKLFVRVHPAGANVDTTIQHVLDFGISDDPLLTGTFITTVVSTTVLPNNMLTHVFLDAALITDSTVPSVTHRVTLANTSASVQTIVHVWVEGLFEESLKVLPPYPPIVI